MSDHVFSNWARALCALVAIASANCVNVGDSDVFTITPPSREQFAPVGDFLVQRCGSLDCHGAIGRNLRIYGVDGLRLDAPNIPGSEATTLAEYDADYESVVWLQPEVMSAVVLDHGANPERLTFVEKPRGADNHKGGTLIQIGDQQDICITSWLSGTTNQAACANALKTP